jgi:hypothetical protein
MIKKSTIKKIAIALLLLALFGIANYLTTPKECRSNDISTLSQFCIDLRFPH